MIGPSKIKVSLTYIADCEKLVIFVCISSQRPKVARPIQYVACVAKDSYFDSPATYGETGKTECSSRISKDHTYTSEAVTACSHRFESDSK